MPLPHPLCNFFPLQTGVLAVAILNIVGSAVVILVGLVLLCFNFESNDDSMLDEGTLKTAFSIMGISLLFAGVVMLLLSILLFQGAKTKNVKKCQIWMVIAILGNVMMVINLFTGSGVLPHLGGLVFESYCMWIVWEFVQETKREQESGGGCISGP